MQYMNLTIGEREELQLTSESWLRTGTQEGVGRVSVCDMPSFMFQHDRAHKAEIEAWKGI